MTYAKEVLVAFDQVGNALAGGSSQCTISGRTGYYAIHSVEAMLWYWVSLQFIIDTTFYPWDGKGHCKQAYEKETNEFKEVKHAIPLVLFLLSLITISSCLVIAPISWSIFGFKKLIKSISKNK
jgi:hypothetical protein